MHTSHYYRFDSEGTQDSQSDAFNRAIRIVNKTFLSSVYFVRFIRKPFREPHTGDHRRETYVNRRVTSRKIVGYREKHPNFRKQNSPRDAILKRIKMAQQNSGSDSRIAGGSTMHTTAATAAVSVKLPEFWKTDPLMWFAQAEAQFALAGIKNDQTKFFHIIAKVDQTVLRHISDIVANPPAQDKYDSVKTRLISRFELSAQEKFEKLLNSCDLGDMRPTHLLAKMQELATNLNVNEDLMKMLFMQRMPTSIRAVLAVCDVKVDQLAAMADKMVDSSGPQVAAAAAPAVPDLQDLEAQIAALTSEVRRLKAGPNRERSRSFSRRRSDSQPAQEICWYHRKFRAAAQQCRSPCRYNQSKN